jgi:hypothetical protein
MSCRLETSIYFLLSIYSIILLGFSAGWSIEQRKHKQYEFQMVLTTGDVLTNATYSVISAGRSSISAFLFVALAWSFEFIKTTMIFIVKLRRYGTGPKRDEIDPKFTLIIRWCLASVTWACHVAALCQLVGANEIGTISCIFALEMSRVVFLSLFNSYIDSDLKHFRVLCLLYATAILLFQFLLIFLIYVLTQVNRNNASISIAWGILFHFITHFLFIVCMFVFQSNIERGPQTFERIFLLLDFIWGTVITIKLLQQ